MSLRLDQAIPGKLSNGSICNVASLVVQDRAVIAYTSASNVVLLDHDLQLKETLSFWSALPHRVASSSKQIVEGVVSNNADNLIIAWSGTHAVIWQHKLLKGEGSWSVHSTLVLSSQITCLDYKSGILAVGTKLGVEIWRHDPKSTIVVWDRMSERILPSPDYITISPASGHLACFSKSERCVRVLTMNVKGDLQGMPQEMRHPREIDWIGWRKPRSSTSGDAHLYTITTNSVLRIYAPVLDDPAWFQLHSTLDGRSVTSPSVVGRRIAKATSEPKGRSIPLDAEVMRKALTQALAEPKSHENLSPEVRKKIDLLLAEETDIVLWAGDDGSVAARSVLNMDRKPPTLFRSALLARLILPQSPFLDRKPHISQFFHLPSSSTIYALTTSPSADIGLVSINPISLLSGKSDGMTLISPMSGDTSSSVQLGSDITSFVRAPNGRGLLAMSENGEIGVWSTNAMVTSKTHRRKGKSLLGQGSWTSDRQAPPLVCATFANGRGVVTFSQSPDRSAQVSLQYVGDTGSPTNTTVLPDFDLSEDETIKMIMAVSDDEEGGDPSGRAIIMAASDAGEVWLWKVSHQTLGSEKSGTINGIQGSKPEISLLSRYMLLTEAGPGQGKIPKFVSPVDPMGWHQSIIDWKNNTVLQDMVLTISEKGVLEFWRPRLDKNGAEHLWTRTGVVYTGIADIIKARCSSRKKTVLVGMGQGGEQEMTIWDSNVSEFSTGLELSKIYGKDDVIQDLDWTTTSDLQSVLAVGFAHKVELVCEQRMGDESTAGWCAFITIDMTQHTSVPINDSIWLDGGSLAVGCGNQIYLFSRFIDRNASDTNAKIGKVESEGMEDIFQLMAEQNGPLLDYHPTLLAQCLVWNKLDLVKEILVNLARSQRTCETNDTERLIFERLDPVAYTKRINPGNPDGKRLAPKYDSLFDTASGDVEMDDKTTFNQTTVTDIIGHLESDTVLIPLSTAEKSMLATIAQATIEVEQQRRSLDICGLRYLISVRMYVNHDRMAGKLSGVTTPASSVEVRPRSRLSFRNIVWAAHSESEDVLLGAAAECCPDGKMIWEDAKRLGVFLWLKSAETAKTQLEVMARNRFVMDEDRDPTCCSLIFFALGKKKVIHGLWRQAPGHKEQNLMLKFLANDFELERWKTAATKNAYALLSRQRYEYAAAFFMLAGSPKDAISIVLRQLDDWQLAFALARVVENGTDGPLVKWILTETVVPLAFAGGHRWLATWAFWTLGRRDLAVRVLISPMSDVASDWLAGSPMIPVGTSHNDDPSLLLLFQHLKSKSLQTAKGTSEIKGKTEFDFVLHNARVFCRMGCHPLALDLLRSWSFDRPFFPVAPRRQRTMSHTFSPASPTSPKAIRPSLESMSPSFTRKRRPSFMLSAHGRRDSMVMDMDVVAESEAQARSESPKQVGDVFEVEVEESRANGVEGEGEIVSSPTKEEPRKMGNLMKELKQDVEQGGMEFNMDNFF